MQEFEDDTFHAFNAVERVAANDKADIDNRINSNILDRSAATGIKGMIGDWNADLSNTYGFNSFSNLSSPVSQVLRVTRSAGIFMA